MSSATAITPSPRAGREGEVRNNFTQPGQNMSAPLQTIHDRGQARGDQAQSHLGQISNNAATYGMKAAQYGDKAYGIGNAGSANAYAAGERLEGAGGQGGAIGSQYGGALTQAGMAGGKAIAPGQAGLYGQADRMNATATGLAGLEDRQGPSAAQAQLTSATAKGQAANLAMARSGGFGGGASRSAQALRQNAGMGQEAANQSAVLKASEDAAWRGRQANNMAAAGGLQGQAGGLYSAAGQLGLGATGQNIQALGAGSQAALGGNAQNIGAIQGSGQLGVAGTQLANQGAQTGIAANQAGVAGQAASGQIAAAGYGIGNQSDQLSGQAIAQDQAAKEAYERHLLQIYGVQAGQDVANMQSSNAFTGAMVGAGATMLPLMVSDERQKVKLSSGTRGNPYGARGAPGNMSGSPDPIGSAPGTGDWIKTSRIEDPASETGASLTPEQKESLLQYMISKNQEPTGFNPYGAALSDERQKDFRDVKNERYVYKDPSLPGAAPGEQYGPMAQDIEKKHPEAIIESPNGKMVQQDRLVMPVAGAVGDLQRKVDRLEGLLAKDSGRRTAENSHRPKGRAA